MTRMLYKKFGRLPLLVMSILLTVMFLPNSAVQAENNQDSLLTGFSQVSAGKNHSLGIGENKKVYSWGNNDHGKLGLGEVSSVYVNAPTLVLGLPEDFQAVAVSAGGEHSLALGEDGVLYAWGSNLNRQLNGSLSPTISGTAIVVQTNSLTKIVGISAGGNFSLAIEENGSGRSWGDNAAAQLGIGRPGITFVGVRLIQIPAGVELASVDAGFDHALAISTTGQVYSWGSNAGGKLGRLTGVTPNLTSQGDIPEDVKIVDVSAGINHSVAIADDGQAYAWGANALGQLGNDSTNNSLTPVKVHAGEVPVETKLLSIAAGNHSVAIADDGQAYSWGANAFGQLGNDSTNNSLTPVKVYAGEVTAGTTLLSITANYNHSLVTGSDGQAYGWGYNVQGQIGDATTVSRKTPVLVSTSQQANQDFHFVKSSAGFEYSVALGNDGSIYTAGSNKYGQLGNQSAVVGGYNQNFMQISLPENVEESFYFVDVAAGAEHVLALGNNGKLYTWGNNVLGQLGQETEQGYNNRPTLVETPENVEYFTSIVAGGSHSAAIGSGENGRKVYTWGHNGFGQLGRETELGYSKNLAEVNISENSDSDYKLAAGESHTLLIKDNSEVYAFGANSFGQLGDGSNVNSVTPILLTPEEGVEFVDVAAGKFHSLALTEDGKTYAWGANNFGQLGDGSVGAGNSSPSLVSFPENAPTEFVFTTLAAGDYHSFAFGNDNKIYAWGANQFDQLGVGGSVSVLAQAQPVVVPEDLDFENVAAGGKHSVAVDLLGDIYTWGDNSSGQLGRLVENNANVPVLVVVERQEPIVPLG